MHRIPALRSHSTAAFYQGLHLGSERIEQGSGGLTQLVRELHVLVKDLNLKWCRNGSDRTVVERWLGVEPFIEFIAMDHDLESSGDAAHW